MRARALPIAGMLVAGVVAGAYYGQPTSERRQSFNAAAGSVMASASAASVEAPVRQVDFATEIRPILEARCRPCHFAGGKMYARLPFDRAETIVVLREKLFTRIKDEKERRPIREFLAVHPRAGAAG